MIFVFLFKLRITDHQWSPSQHVLDQCCNHTKAEAWLCCCLSDTVDLGPLVQNVSGRYAMIRNDSAQCACCSCWGISWYGKTWFVRPVALGTQAELQTRPVSLRSRAATMLKANFQLSQKMSAVASWKTKPYSAAASPENPVPASHFGQEENEAATKLAKMQQAVVDGER